MSAKTQLEKEVREAYLFLRKKNYTVPSETLDFMLKASLKEIDSLPEHVEDNGIIEDYMEDDNGINILVGKTLCPMCLNSDDRNICGNCEKFDNFRLKLVKNS